MVDAGAADGGLDAAGVGRILDRFDIAADHAAEHLARDIRAQEATA